MLETASPPQIYLPPEDIVDGALEPVSGHTVCEWKGLACYADVVGGGERAERAAWFYPSPNPRYEELRGWVSFYPGRVDGAYIGEERVRPQAGRVLRRLGHRRHRGPDEGRAGHRGLVARPGAGADCRQAVLGEDPLDPLEAAARAHLRCAEVLDGGRAA